MLTLFLFQRELDQLKNEYLTSVDTTIKTQVLKDIELMIKAIKDIKETWGVIQQENN